MNATIDSTYDSVVFSLPADLRESARGLLASLGLAQSPAARWADVFQLEPSRELPIFAIPFDTAFGEDTLAAFLRAHHCACFYNVLVDRMADQQAARTPERKRLAEHFLSNWQRDLAEATGDDGRARWAIARSMQSWRQGVRLERAALARRSLEVGHYGRSILLKLGWAGLASECLLRQQMEAHRVQLFRCAFHLLAVGMQCVDDAADCAEDESLHGVSLPAVLGHSPAALFSAGTLLVRAASSAASQGRSERFAAWLSHRTTELESICKRHIRPMDNLAGMAIASTLESLCFFMTGHHPSSTAATTSCANST